MKRLYLISDSTGELGDRFVNALLTQFPHDRLVCKKFNFVTAEDDARKVMAKIAANDTVLFHTVIDRKLKKLITSLCRERGIASLDLTGPPTDFLIEHLKLKPEWNVSVIHSINPEYHRRIDAIEFTIGHDDGAGAQDLKRADAVLVGPSRTSKTPTSMYLATKGFKVANIPLIRQLGEPEKLQTLKADPRVFAMGISPEKLREVRLKRALELGIDPPGYTEASEIRKELQWVRRLYSKYGWKTIDVTDRAIEETAAMIMRRVQRRA